MEPIFTNDAIVFGLLMLLLAGVFYTSSLDHKGWKRFYTFVPTVLLCYFLPALLHWPLGLVASEWFTPDLLTFLNGRGQSLPSENMSFSQIKYFLDTNNIPEADYKKFIGHSSLYFVASRYLLPASLVLLCISIDFKGILNLGPKALIMFFAATLGVVVGGPIALFTVLYLAPEGFFQASSDEIWRGLSTIAGSWIGGGANQAAMKEIFDVGSIFTTMVVVDVLVANIWLGFLLYGINISDRIDRWLQADNSAIEDLKNKVEAYRASIAEMPTTTGLFVLLGITFGVVGLSHFLADVVSAFMQGHKETLKDLNLTSLTSHFFWLVVFSTTSGLILSFTKARKYEGIGASRWGSVCIFILVATIGMHMNIGDVFSNLGLFAIGLIWISIHILVLLLTAKIIRAPFFFVAVGSQANIGGAASAPVVASAFSPSLAPVGVLMAVLGYALGTYGAIICALLMQQVAT
ncbi:MAG: DUF819 family protein [Bacteroidota bacterium]